MFTLKSRILVISSINKTADSSWQLLLLTRIRGCHSAAALCFHYFFLCLLDGVRFTLLEIEKGRRFCLSKPAKRRPNFCDSFSAMMPLFFERKVLSKRALEVENCPRHEILQFKSGQLLRNLHKNLWFKRRNPGSKKPGNG